MVISWRIRNKVNPIIMCLINDPRRNQILVFPSERYMIPGEGRKEVERRRREGRECHRREKSVL